MAQLPRSRPADLAAERVRSARPGDRAAILDMWGALLRSHGELHPSYRVGEGANTALSATLLRELRDPHAVVLVATVEDSPDPTGFCIARYTAAPAPVQARDEFEAPAEIARGFVDELWVAAGRRRRGTGRRLVAAALDALERAGVTRVEVRVLRANANAQGFWRALGFAPYVDILEQRLQRR